MPADELQSARPRPRRGDEVRMLDDIHLAGRARLDDDRPPASCTASRKCIRDVLAVIGNAVSDRTVVRNIELVANR